MDNKGIYIVYYTMAIVERGGNCITDSNNQVLNCLIYVYVKHIFLFYFISIECFSFAVYRVTFISHNNLNISYNKLTRHVDTKLNTSMLGSRVFARENG